MKREFQKKLLATAVVAALGAPALALAQASTVQVYGRFYMEYAYVDQGMGTTGPLNNIDAFQSAGSNIGFKGEEKLGGGLSAWFQCESTADLRGQGQEGFCSRNSAVGFKGGFGNIYLGRWDTPFKRTINAGLAGSQLSGIIGYANVLGGGAGSQIGNAARGVFISRRQSNMVMYDSPRFGGFGVMAGFSSGQSGGTGQGTASTSGAVNAKPRVLSLGANYRAGPLYLGAAYEQHSEFGAAATAGPGVGDLNDDAWGFSAAYTLGSVKVGGGFLRQEFEMSTTTKSEIDAWHIGADWKIAGPHKLRAAWTRADDVGGNSVAPLAASGGAGYRPAAINAGLAGSTGADLWSVTYQYDFSKRTYATLSYARLDNDANAAYRMRNTFGSPVVRGNSEDGIAVAVSHRF